MERRQVTCSVCGGLGKITNWKAVFETKNSEICTMQSKDVVCGNCNGLGWKEYAVFSVEEAEAILKHCGLPTES